MRATGQRSYASRVATMRRILDKTTNPVLRAFRYSWDGSEHHAHRFLDEVDGWDVDSATRDAAADFIEDLIRYIRDDH